MAVSTKRVAGEDSVHYVSPRRKRARPKPRMQPPLTPMIDVTFQLLLFFLMTFTFRQAEGQIPGTLPRGVDPITGPPPPIIDDPIRISLLPVGPDRTKVVYEVQGHATVIRTPQELGDLLQERAAQRGKDVSVIIKCRADVQWRWVVEAFNQSVRAEFTHVGFARGAL